MKHPHFGTAGFIFFVFAIVIAVVMTLTGCVDIPLEVDEDDVKGREELSVADVKQTLKALYGVPGEDLKFRPYYDHFHLYERWEIERRFSELWFIREFEYHREHRNCVWLGQAAYVYMYGHMPGVPMFEIDLRCRTSFTCEGHLYVGVIIQPDYIANRICLILDPRYPLEDDRAIQELDMDRWRIGQIRMTPEKMTTKQALKMFDMYLKTYRFTLCNGGEGGQNKAKRM